jgi:hypothetical protein
MPAGPKRKRSVSPSKKRHALIPKTCVLVIPDAKPNDIYHELRGLNLEEFPNAVGVLFRVFLELSIDRYLLTFKLMNKTTLAMTKLRVKVIQVADHLQKTGVMTKKELVAVRRIADPHHFLAGSIETLHAYVHDANFAAGPSDLKAAWNSLEPFFVRLWA